MARFPITSYMRNARGDNSNIPDLAKCAFPLCATPSQIDAYLQLTLSNINVEPSILHDRVNNNIGNLLYSSNTDKKIFGAIQAIYGGDTFVTYSSHYRCRKNTNGYEYSNEINVSMYKHDNNNLIIKCYEFYDHSVHEMRNDYVCNNFSFKYLYVSLICGKRREEFLSQPIDELESVFNDMCNYFCTHLSYFLPRIHRYIIPKRNRQNIKLSYAKAVQCPLFVEYVKLHWHYRDILMSKPYNELIANNNAKLSELMAPWPQCRDPQFVHDLVVKSLTVNAEDTTTLLLDLFKFL